MLSGAPLTYIQNRMGHKKLDMTAITYNHLTKQATEEGNALLNEINSITKKVQ